MRAAHVGGGERLESVRVHPRRESPPCRGASNPCRPELLAPPRAPEGVANSMGLQWRLQAPMKPEWTLRTGWGDLGAGENGVGDARVSWQQQGTWDSKVLGVATGEGLEVCNPPSRGQGGSRGQTSTACHAIQRRSDGRTSGRSPAAPESGSVLRKFQTRSLGVAARQSSGGQASSLGEGVASERRRLDPLNMGRKPHLCPSVLKCL